MNSTQFMLIKVYDLHYRSYVKSLKIKAPCSERLRMIWQHYHTRTHTHLWLHFPMPDLKLLQEQIKISDD